MNAIKLKGEERKVTGKEQAKKLRDDKRLPAVIYGPGMKESINISIDYQEFDRIFSKYAKHSIISLEIGKNSYQVLVKDYKFHPVRRTFMHVDFYNVIPDTAFSTEVPINFIGVPVGVKEGGMLYTLKRKLKISATDKSLPHVIDVDISNVKTKQYLTVREIEQTGDYKILTHKGNVLVEVK